MPNAHPKCEKCCRRHRPGACPPRAQSAVPRPTKGNDCQSMAIFLPGLVRARLLDLLETGLYGNTPEQVCETIIARGVENAIARGIILK